MRRRTLLALAALPAAGQAAEQPADQPAICSGSDAGLCRLADSVAADGSNTHALLVQRGAGTLAEAYFSGRDKPSGTWFEHAVQFSADHPHDLRSISKSVTGLVAGIAHGRGQLVLDRPVLVAVMTG